MCPGKGFFLKETEEKTTSRCAFFSKNVVKVKRKKALMHTSQFFSLPQFFSSVQTLNTARGIERSSSMEISNGVLILVKDPCHFLKILSD